MKNTDTHNFLHQVLNIDLNDYFKSLGMQQISVQKDIVKYSSPFGSEHPLEVRKKHAWYDPATGPSTKNIFEFAARHHDQNVTEFLYSISTSYLFPHPNPVHPDLVIANKNQFGHLHPKVGERNLPLREEDYQFIKERFMVPKGIAEQYLNRVELIGFPDISYGIAFVNDNGGMHINYGNQKSFTHEPHGATTFDYGSSYVDVFRSIDDLMALQALRGTPEVNPNNIVVLNKLFLFEDLRPYLEAHKQVNLYLDHHDYSKEVVGYAAWLDSNKYKDFSQPYKNDHSLRNVLRSALRYVDQVDIKISRKKGNSI